MGNLHSSDIKQEILSQNKFALGFDKLHNTKLEGWEKSEVSPFNPDDDLPKACKACGQGPAVADTKGKLKKQYNLRFNQLR